MSCLSTSTFFWFYNIGHDIKGEIYFFLNLYLSRIYLQGDSRVSRQSLLWFAITGIGVYVLICYYFHCSLCFEDKPSSLFSCILIFFSTGIRLGDYNINNKTDCVDTTGIKECSDPVEEFGIEKVIIHPEYVT